MNVRKIFGEEIAEKIKEVLRYAKHSTKEERLILINCLRDEARKQQKDMVQISLLKLAEYIEKMASNQVLE
ncbi:hypothetical protein [Enterococcus sp. DIV1420a]|uniref:hypothetical protein n=1 Tax=Enterococcus sp. DIV1420a TaxID=2774672 RepID=UPI003F1FF11D